MKSAEIAQEFAKFYEALYNLPATASEEPSTSRQEKIKEYLANSKMPKMTEEQIAALERLLTLEEVL